MMLSRKYSFTKVKRLGSMYPPAYLENVKLAVQMLKEGKTDKDIIPVVGKFVYQSALEFRKWV